MIFIRYIRCLLIRIEVSIFSEATKTNKHDEFQAFVDVGLEDSFPKAFPSNFNADDVTARFVDTQMQACTPRLAALG